MLVGSVPSELAELTWLILGVLAFIALLIFRSELKQLMSRLTNFEARRKDSVIRADLQDQPADTGDSQTESIGSSLDASEESESSQPDALAEPEADADQPEDLAIIRREMINAYFRSDDK